MTGPETAIDGVYKEHSARILAALVRLFGAHNLELAEDVLQESFRKALDAWRESGLPDNPASWIMTAAKRQAIDVIRAQRTQRKFSAELAHHLESGWTLVHTVEQEFDETRINDHQLRMIFMCTNADLTPEGRIPLILRTLCGFSVPAIARALLLPEPTIKKRLVRARNKLRDHAFEFPAADKLPAVMDSVHTVVYLLFNEGFHSSDDEHATKPELCREAIHLVSMLLAEPRVVYRDTLALLALMRFHLARAGARFDASGHPVALDCQDRRLWNVAEITEARELLVLAAHVVPGANERFFIEAKIAEQHCLAASFDATNWPEIVRWYDELVQVTGSPVAVLNQAVAIGYAGDVHEAMQRVNRAAQHEALRGSHLPAAVRAHLAAMTGDETDARAQAAEAARLGGTAHERRALSDQIERLLARRMRGQGEVSDGQRPPLAPKTP